MAHFAKLGTENIVETVEVVSNDIATTEQAGIDFLRNLYKDENAQWVQTSYNSNIRKRFAGIGYTYDETRDAFISPKPFCVLDIKRNNLFMGSTSCLSR